MTPEVPFCDSVSWISSKVEGKREKQIVILFASSLMPKINQTSTILLSQMSGK